MENKIIDFAVDMEQEGYIGDVYSTGVLSDPIYMFKQGIEMLFDTEPGSVLGDDDYGGTLENFTWDLSVSNDTISNYVSSTITKCVPIASEFDMSVNTTLLQGEINDIILVTIEVRHKTSGDTYTQTYKID